MPPAEYGRSHGAVGPASGSNVKVHLEKWNDNAAIGDWASGLESGACWLASRYHSLITLKIMQNYKREMRLSSTFQAEFLRSARAWMLKQDHREAEGRVEHLYTCRKACTCDKFNNDSTCFICFHAKSQHAHFLLLLGRDKYLSYSCLIHYFRSLMAGILARRHTSSLQQQTG